MNISIDKASIANASQKKKIVRQTKIKIDYNIIKSSSLAQNNYQPLPWKQHRLVIKKILIAYILGVFLSDCPTASGCCLQVYLTKTNKTVFVAVQRNTRHNWAVTSPAGSQRNTKRCFLSVVSGSRSRLRGQRSELFLTWSDCFHICTTRRLFG